MPVYPKVDQDAVHLDESSEISGLAEKLVPLVNDVLIIESTNENNTKRKVQIGNLPGGVAGGSDTVKASGTDTVPATLADKLSFSNGVATVLTNPGGNEVQAVGLGRHYRALGSTALYSGGLLSINADTTKFDVAAGEGLHIDATTTPAAPAISPVTFGPFSAVAPANMLTHPVTYVCVDSAGTLVQLDAPPTGEQRRTYLTIGIVVHSNNLVVNAINNLPVLGYNVQSNLRDLGEALGLINQTGNRISPNGANLSIDKSAGILFLLGANYENNVDDPNEITEPLQIAATFRYRNQDSSEGVSTILIDPTTWDNAGSTTAVPNPNNATIQRIYMFPSGQLRLQRGQTVYPSLSDALSAVSQESPIVEPNIADNGILLGLIALKKNTTQLNDTTDALFFQAGRLGDLPSAGSSSVTSLQNAYDNSLTPEVVTNTTLGALTVRRGSAADTDNVIEAENGAGTVTFIVSGEGRVTFTESGTSTALTTGAIADGNLLVRSGTTLIGESPAATLGRGYLPVAGGATPHAAAAGTMVEVTTGAVGYTVNLPNPGVLGDRIGVKKVDAGVGSITVSVNGGPNVDGGTTVNLPAQYDYMSFIRGTTQWWVE